MAADPDYPRMLYRHSAKEDWMIVQSAEQEAALGSEWSRTFVPEGSEPEPEPSQVPARSDAVRTATGRFAPRPKKGKA